MFEIEELQWIGRQLWKMIAVICSVVVLVGLASKFWRANV